MQSLFEALTSIFSRKKRQDEWDARFDNQPHRRADNLPLEPEKDPWRT